MKCKITIYTLVCMLFLGAVSCKDDLLYDNGEIGEGECVIGGTVKFTSFTPALNGNTRTAGNVIKAIESLCVLLYDEKGQLVKKYPLRPGDAVNEGVYKITDTDRKNEDRTESVGGEDKTFHSAETETPHADFKLTVPYGRYYIYAVANMGDLSDSSTDENIKKAVGDINIEDAIQTVEGLKNISLNWNEENIPANNQMFGHFFSSDRSSEAQLLTINQKTSKLQAWVRRAASKVTVAYDGTGLYDDVYIYIMAVSIKDIPRSCLLGETNTPTDSLIHDGEIIKYFKGDGLPADFKEKYIAIVSNKDPNRTYGSDHSETAEALFFYENMQGTGEDKRQKDEDKDGKPDNADRLKDDKPYGTYIEVDAIYRSENSERPGTGVIKYRFMLGKNITTDYNAERNHHYKLTLKFKKFANDYDWHIDYKRAVFDVTEPEVFNYQGKIFIPEYRPGTENYNLGHTFVDENTVTVRSFIEENFTTVPWTISYDEKGDGNFKDTCSWLEYTEDGYLPYMKNISFKVKSLEMEEIDIDDNLQHAKQKGTEEAPYNLANPGQTVSPADATIKCTANCYIVDAPGYYILPLVYGNAFHNSQPNKSAYEYSSSDSDDPKILSTFRDYLGNKIKSPYIKDDTKPEYTPQSAFLVWQDENDLVSYNVWYPTRDIKYLPEAYKGKGGILFRIERDNIKQGNAVIGVSTGAIHADTKVTLPPVMWSWHIWVTDFSYLEENDKNIEVTGHDTSQKFKFLPVNLGWCSGHGDKIKYYKGRKCKVKFTVVGNMQEPKFIEIEQKSHIAFTRGNNPYYQWGRKDPFVGATGNVQNKIRYYSVNWGDDAKFPMLSDTLVADNSRYTTRGAIDAGLLIQKPQTWHNPRRIKNPNYIPNVNYPYLSDNLIYINLWQGRLGVQAGSPTLKTVYDPCPVGYQVPHYNAFSGFTTTGDDTSTPFEWYDVRIENIAGYDKTTGSCGIYSDGLYEFYTDATKLQSIIFPETGYRDWDDFANAYKIVPPSIGYIWTAGNKNGDDNNSYNFEFSRADNGGYIRPKNVFYPCDGFPIRPCVYDNHTANTP